MCGLGLLFLERSAKKACFQPSDTQLMQWYNDLSGKMRHLTIKQDIRKPPVSHYSRHFRFKDGLILVTGSDKEMACPSGDLGMAKLFFPAFKWYLKGT